ncbi:MAG: ACP S-malonyltransferase [Acidimicrobiales bacterium]|nr:ACP S-malonyltransferase [Acidimicrobiales bacterium]
MIAFTFPGQGSQKPGMGDPWTEHPSWELVAEASEASGHDVGRLLLRADADELKQTHNAQVATFVLSLVILDAVERLGVAPAVVAGHSLGEYTALVASGAIALDEGTRLVAQRGQAMHEASRRRLGTMAAVLGLDDDDVAVACARADGDVWVANYNAPGQVVIAGNPESIERAGAIARQLGAKRVMPLAVGGAFHTPYMAPARDDLKKAICETEIRDPELPIYANIDARSHQRGAEWADLLSAQLCGPVRWRQTLYGMADAGVTTFIELGPGSALTGMAKRTIESARCLSVSEPADLDRLLTALHLEPPAEVGLHEGEHLFATERVIVSPAAGVFTPARGVDPGTAIAAGAVVGHVGDNEVRSPFGGVIVGVLAVDGERVSQSQPIAWLRIS